MRKKIKHWYYFAGLAAFLLLVARSDPSKINEALAASDTGLLLAAALLSLGVQFVKTLRWMALLRLYGILLPLGSAFSIYLTGTFLGTVTPGRLGDASRIFYLKKRPGGDLPAGQLLANIVADRITDIVTVFLVAFTGVVYYLKDHRLWVIPAGLFTACLVPALYIFRHRALDVIGSLLRLAGKSIPGIHWENHLDEFVEGLRRLRTAGIASAAGWNAAAYGVFYAAVVLIARSIGITTPVLYLITALSAAMLVSVLPVSVAGIGVRDAVLLFFLFLPGGVKYEMVLVFSMMYLFLLLILPALLGGVLYFGCFPGTEEIRHGYKPLKGKGG